MYKLIIVDDEPAETKFLRWVVTNYNLPFTICGEAVNGEDAVRLVEQHQPDFVIMDINMPIMDGLEAARRIKDKFPRTKIYILTAYGDFTYAQAAIKISVEDYLLKPMNPETMVEALKKGVKQVLSERVDQRRQDRMRLLARKSKEEMINRLVLELSGPQNSRRTEQVPCSKLGPLAGMQWVFAGHLLREGTVIREEAYLNSLSRKLKQSSLVKHASLLPGGQVIAWGKGQLAESMTVLRKWTKDWSEQALVSVGGCVMLVGSSVDIEKVLRQALRESDDAQFWEEAEMRCVVPVVVTGKMNSAVELDIRVFAQRLVSALFSTRQTTAATVIEELLFELKLSGSSREQVIQNLTDLFAAVAHELTDLTGETYLSTLRSKLQKTVGQMDTVSQVRAVLAKLVDGLVSSVCGSSESDAERAVKWAVQFIRQNYQQDLSLEVVASKLYLSPCYFSRIFKKHTGQGFSNYLNGFRLQKAKGLLTMGKYTVAEVAHRIGIHDASYFCSVFKKYHKATPSQFLGGNTRQEI